MLLRNSTIKDFNELTTDKRIVCFGASKMPEEFCEWYDSYHFESKIRYIGDNDPKKDGIYKTINGKKIPVYNFERFVNNIEDGDVILITSRYYYEIIKQLNDVAKLNDHECYVFPLFELEHHRFTKISTLENQGIPKIIHYCWFGGGPKPKLNQACIDSWKKFCPDYEIIEWNPNNCDMDINYYVSEAYHKCKQWGAVSDYFSAKILYEYGGIYFDTDVQLVRNIDAFLYNKAFASFDSTNGMINFGSGAGTVKGNRIFKEIQDLYEDLHFLNADNSRNDAANYIYQTKILKKYGLELNNSRQELKDITIFPSECFCPYDLRTGVTNITANTYGIHQFDGSWWDSERKRVYNKQQAQNAEIRLLMEQN